jgi:hypothetical protein
MGNDIFVMKEFVLEYFKEFCPVINVERRSTLETVG